MSRVSAVSTLNSHNMFDKFESDSCGTEFFFSSKKCIKKWMFDIFWKFCSQVLGSYQRAFDVCVNQNLELLVGGFDLKCFMPEIYEKFSNAQILDF